MFESTRLRHDFNNAAAHYDAHATLQRHVLATLYATLPALAPHALMLDAGCGTGALARLSQHPRIIGVDNAFNMCHMTRSLGAPTMQADMSTLPLADESVEVVFSSLALQWAPHWQHTLREWLRVLKPGGALRFSTFSAGTLHELASSFRQVDSYSHISRFLTAEELGASFPALQVSTETVTEYYPDLTQLSRHLKSLGARHKQTDRRPTLMTPRQFRQAEDYYRAQYGTEQGLPVSWNILYASACKEDITGKIGS